MEKERFDEINELWNEHAEIQFPSKFAGKDVNNIDLVLLDSNIVGCVISFLENKNLNLYQTAILGLSYKNVSFIMPILNEAGAEYFWRLERLAELLLIEIAKINLAEHKKD